VAPLPRAGGTGIRVDGDALVGESPEGCGFQCSGKGCTLGAIGFQQEAHVCLVAVPLFQVTNVKGGWGEAQGRKTMPPE